MFRILLPLAEEVVKGSRNKGNRRKKKKITVDGSDVKEIQPIIDACKEPIVGKLISRT